MMARLRLILAILALALAPLTVPAQPVSAHAAPAYDSMIMMSDGQSGCGHHSPCDDGQQRRNAAACAVACAVSASLSAPLLPPSVVGAAVPAVARQRQEIPVSDVLSATLWPPPLRPPRF
jgi:hypothetical protein